MNERYEKVLRRVYSKEGLVNSLRIIDLISVFLTVISFSLGTYIAFCIDVWVGVGFLLTLALAYALVSAVRHFINAPRPYELLDFSNTAPKLTKGHSFPSRHVFSAFAIGTAELFICPPLAIPTLVFGVCLGVCRCLLGIHFPRDVIAGAIIGCVTSVIGMLVI